MPLACFAFGRKIQGLLQAEKVGFFVTHDCEPILRLIECISRIEMEAGGQEVRVSQLAHCGGCCRPVCLCLCQSLQNPIAVMPRGTWGIPSVIGMGFVWVSFVCVTLQILSV